MRKVGIVPVALLAVLLCPYTAAQTLDEVLRPLLGKGQWDLSLRFQGFIDNDNGFYEYDPRRILSPGLAFGLTKNLQWRISGAYQFPRDVSVGRDHSSLLGEETNVIRSVSTQLLFRPAANLELSLFYLHGRAKEGIHLAYPQGVVHHTQESADNILILRGTWLSRVDGESGPLRPDLDGLRGPLLKKGRWRVDPEILVRSHEMRQRYDALPDYEDENSDSIDTRLRLSASYGMSDHLEAKADGYWQPSFRINETQRSSYTRWDGTVLYFERDGDYLYTDYWGVRGSLAWRPSPRMELNLALSRNGLKLNLGREQEHTLSQIDLSATWLSRPKRPGIPLVAGLAGIYHPLLEKNQISLDLRMCYRAYREGDYAGYGWFGTNSWLFRIQSAYGLGHSLQASLYFGIHPQKTSLSSRDYDWDTTLGGEMKLRLKGCAEIFAVFNIKPQVHFDAYPPFMLEQGYRDFLSSDFNEDGNIGLGCRLVF